jgi:hypothetical protein
VLGSHWRVKKQGSNNRKKTEFPSTNRASPILNSISCNDLKVIVETGTA